MLPYLTKSKDLCIDGEMILDHVGQSNVMLKREREGQRVRGKDVTMAAEVRAMVTRPGSEEKLCLECPRRLGRSTALQTP